MMQVKNNDEKWIGEKFGRLTVIGFEKKKSGQGWMWRVRCECGKEKIVFPGDVKSGKTRSCGCLHDECIAERARKFEHGVYEYRRLYRIYNGVKKRCYSKSEPRYKDYGMRGIEMCAEWVDPVNGFDRFVEWSLANRYDDNLTLERKDVDGNYCPQNCEWITRKDQAKNKRDTIWVAYKGEHIRLLELCQREKVIYDTVHDRIFKRGWSIERAIETPSERENSLMSKCREKGLNYGTVRDRIVKFGWSEERALNTPSVGRGANRKTYGGMLSPRKCAVCGMKFVPNSGKQIYCGEKCRNTSKRISWRREHTK